MVDLLRKIIFAWFVILSCFPAHAQRKEHILHNRIYNFASFTTKDKYLPAPKAIEKIEKRTVDTKFYVNKDTSTIIYSQKSSIPIHYKKNGQWTTIDERLAPQANGCFEASQQEDPVGFDTRKRSAYIKMANGPVYFNDWRLFGEKNGVETLLATADWSSFTAGDDGLSIKNIFPGIDAEMSAERGGIKTNFIVHSNNFPGYAHYLLRDRFSGQGTEQLSFSGGETGEWAEAAAELSVGRQKLLHIAKGIMYGQNDPAVSHSAIPYRLDHNELTLSISAGYLSTMLKRGNVVIDPLVQDTASLALSAITGSMFNPDSSFATPCQYTMNVPTPPEATVTSALYTFAFTAYAPCVMSDGAFSFSTGTCGSDFWIGPEPTVGTTAATNANMLLAGNSGNVSFCFPTPTCGSQDIPFTFNFYRRIHGPAGCDGSCVGASSALIITLVGHTFEYDDSAFSVSADTICTGQSVTFTALGQYGVQPYTYTWDNIINLGIGEFTLVGTTPTITIQPTSGVYGVRVSDYCNPLPLYAEVWNKEVTIVANPGPLIFPFVTNSPVCAGDSLNVTPFTGGGIGPVLPPQTYNWTGPGDFTSNDRFITIPDAQTSNSGNYFYTVTLLSDGCSSVDTVNMVVNPTATPTVSIQASNTAICAGAPVTFTATATNSGTTPGYQWQLNGADVGTNSPNYTGTNLANQDNVLCLVTSNAVCAPSTPTASNGITETVTPYTTPAVSISSSAQTICAGTTVNFNASATSAGTAPAYQWQLDGTNVGANSATYSSATLANGDNVDCIVTSSDVCTTQASATSQAVVLTVSPIEKPSVSIAASPTTVCTGNPITFTATGSGSGNLDYQWQVNGTSTGSDNAVFTDNNPANNDVISCILSTSSTCSQPDTSNTIAVTVSQAITPALSITASDSIVCKGTTVTFSAAAANEGSNPAYQWQVNGTDVGTNTASYSTSELNNQDNVNCILTASGLSCATSTTATSNIIDMMINPLPVVTPGPTQDVFLGASVILPVMVTGDIASYQWTPSTGLDNPAKEEPSASPDTSTLYTLHAVSTSGCVGSGSIDVNVETKVLVPNAFSPNGDGIHDTWNITGLNGYPGATVDVFNRWGQLVFHSEGYSNPWDGRYSGGLVPTGTYYYVIDPKNNKSKMKGPLTIFR